MQEIGVDTAENEPSEVACLPVPDFLLGPWRNSRGSARPECRTVVLANFANFSNFANWQILQFFLQNFVNFWRARSRQYQNEILQENMRLTAFFKLYKICILLHRCNLKILAKIVDRPVVDRGADVPTQLRSWIVTRSVVVVPGLQMRMPELNLNFELFSIFELSQYLELSNLQRA